MPYSRDSRKQRHRRGKAWMTAEARVCVGLILSWKKQRWTATDSATGDDPSDADALPLFFVFGIFFAVKFFLRNHFYFGVFLQGARNGTKWRINHFFAHFQTF